MVYSGMIGITELMTDDSFVVWMENQTDEMLDSLTTFEIYNLYCKEKDPDLN